MRIKKARKKGTMFFIIQMSLIQFCFIIQSFHFWHTPCWIFSIRVTGVWWCFLISRVCVCSGWLPLNSCLTFYVCLASNAFERNGKKQETKGNEDKQVIAIVNFWVFWIYETRMFTMRGFVSQWSVDSTRSVVVVVVPAVVPSWVWYRPCELILVHVHVN